jgi:enterochelin esterase-like enzyme
MPTVRNGLVAVAAVAVCAGLSSSLAAQAAGALEHIRVHGAALEGNLAGDDATRDAFVYLPPSYASSRSRRYPVVYFLHGYGATAERYSAFLELPKSVDEAIAGGGREMIVVLPDAHNAYDGSMYSSSPTTGDWETYVARDLVEYVDGHYRTIAKRESRGLAGHSMGGYGTVRIGMKRPDVFGALYAMSSCCLLIDPARGGDAIMRAARDRAGQAGAASQGSSGPASPFAKAPLAQAAAWAPNPSNPPSFFDLPYDEKGEIEPLIAGKWLANAPLLMVDQYVPSLERYRAIALDVGNEDPLLGDNVNLDAALTRLQVEHTFEQYEGNHGNRIRERFETKLLPFFSKYLDADK